MHVTLIAIAAAMMVQSSELEAPLDTATRNFMFCVRNTAARLEPSGESPRDIADAAVFVCLPEEIIALNLALGEGNPRSQNLRETALFFGASQVVVSRHCRLTGDCELAPAPDYRPSISD
jgi:hypothetical protein